MSQPRKKRIPCVLSLVQTLWIGIHLVFSPLPKVTHICVLVSLHAEHEGEYVCLPLYDCIMQSWRGRDRGRQYSRTVYLDAVAPCSHEEEDTRILLHAQHAVKQRYKSLMIDANYTDIGIIATLVIGLEKNVGDFWQRREDEMGSQSTRWFQPYRTREITWYLFFHAFTGCDISHPPMENQRSLPGSQGTCVMRSQLRIVSCKIWRNLS